MRPVALPVNLNETLSKIKTRLDLGNQPLIDLLLRQRRALSKNQHLYRRGDAADEIYVVLSGSLKAYCFTSDGDEEVIRFYFPADPFGTDGFHANERATSVMALETSIVSSLSMQVLQDFIQEDRTLRNKCYRLLSRMIKEERDFTEMLRRSNAEQRVAAFLLHIREYQCPDSKSDKTPLCQIQVPMTRRDVANYLGLSVETVSRAFSRLRQKRAIRMMGHQLELTDLLRLRLTANAYTNPEYTSRMYG